MRDIEVLDINIIDTKNNDRLLQVEDVAASSVRLIYNGFEDRFGTLMSSELHFSMLVEKAEDGKFFHLFTGSETRYRVELLDVSQMDNPKIIWQGFLLAEQFEEPYVGGSFFVDLVASDGIGRIKNILFNAIGQTGRVSVIDILGSCLLHTGLDLEICFSKAIENIFFELDYLDLEVDVSVYKQQEMSFYEVLEKLLESMGCKIFQYQSRWWVVGLTRFGDAKIPYARYRYSFYDLENPSVLEGQYELERDQLDYVFEATPVVSVIPPLQNIEANWDSKEKTYVIPEDLVSHFPKYYQDDKQDTTPRYWKLITDGKINAFQVFVVHQSSFYDLDSLYYRNEFVLVDFSKQVAGPFFYLQSKEFLDQSDYNQQSGVTFSDIDQNYITLEDPFFLDLKSDEFLSFELELEISKHFYKTDDDLLSAIENKELEGAILYGITYKEFKCSDASQEEFVLWNFSGDQQKDRAFDFELSYQHGVVKAKISIEELQVVKKGYYNIRLYPVIQNDLLGSGVYYRKCHLKFKEHLEKDFSIERDIDFTTSLTLDFFHSSTQRLTTQRRFYLSDRIQDQIDSGLIPTDQSLVDQRYYQSQVNSYGHTIYLIGLTGSDFAKYSIGYRFYVKKSGSSILEVLQESSYLVSQDDEHGKFFIQTDFNIADLNYYFVKADDTLYLKISGDALQEIKYKEAYSNSFTRYYSDDNENFSKALVRSYHDLLNTYKVRFTGTLLGLVGPLDMVFFNFKERKLGSITNLELNLTDGSTQVTLVDHLKGQSQGSITGLLDVDTSPSIEISATLNHPSSHWSLFDFSLWYNLQVSYSIKNLTPVDATLKAVQLDGNPDTVLFGNTVNPTGLVIQSTISQANGNYRFDFPNPIGDYPGYYEVFVEQGAVISNRQVVHLSIPVSDPRQIILQRISVEMLPFSDRTVIRMRYTIQTQGFDPEPLVATEKSGMTTLIIAGQNPNEVSREIDLGQSEYSVDFETVIGFYVKLEIQGVQSNVIHSYL